VNDPREAQALLTEALAREGDAQRLLMAGDPAAAEVMQEVARLYRHSWEVAPPRSFGRLVGMLKAAILAGDAGDASEAADYVRGEIPGDGDSPASSYAVALAALIQGDDANALRSARAMQEGGEAFERTAAAIQALAEGDGERYGRALEAVVADFDSRDDFLTGVAIADTAAALQRLAAQRGLAAQLDSELLPPPG
jgi:hypothetical protein